MRTAKCIRRSGRIGPCPPACWQWIPRSRCGPRMRAMRACAPIASTASRVQSGGPFGDRQRLPFLPRARALFRGGRTAPFGERPERPVRASNSLSARRAARPARQPARHHPAGRERDLRLPRRARQRTHRRHDRAPEHVAQLRADLPLAAGGGAVAREGGADRHGAPRRRVARAASDATWSRATSSASSAGDLVPADARLLEARDLHVQQAALTGESLAGREGGAAAEPSPCRSPSATHRGVPRNLGRQRHGDARRRRHRPRAPRSATSPRAWPRGRPRPSSSAACGVRPPDHAHGLLPGALRARRRASRSTAIR